MKRHAHLHSLLLLILSIFAWLGLTSAVDFVFNGFNSSDMLFYGVAHVESRVLVLTNDTSSVIGRALYPLKIQTKLPNSSQVLPFSTSFIFSIAPPGHSILSGHGIVFLFTPVTGIEGATASQNLGFLNRTWNNNPESHVFGVKFDVFQNEEFKDISDNNVGINVNSLTSSSSHEAGYWPDGKSGGGGNSSSEEDEESFQRLKLNNGKNYQVWVDYSDFHINVTMAVAGTKRPQRPLLSAPLNLSDVFLDEMYVGFTASTGKLVESHRILGWSFSNSNFSLSSELITRGLPSFVPPKSSILQSTGFIAGITVAVLFLAVFCFAVSLFLIRRDRRRARRREEMEEWELEYWPHRITHQEIEAATSGFSEENVIGIGGNGKVYKGVLEGGGEIAVKRISPENDQGMREFLAEISSLGRLKHRCLVALRGWCKRENGTFMLVYDYMENGSLDKKVFDCEDGKILSCKDRIRILKDVASGVLYLHEGWESIVLHRDIKASNVLLDKEMNGRLGDFGLARMHGHDQVATTTRVVGTVGYLAPEIIKTGRASAPTDVFGFGMLILEVLSGRRPMEEGKPHLIDWMWELMTRGQLVLALEERLRIKGEFDDEEVERVLHLGLLCAYPDPSVRPTMRQVVKILEGKEYCESEGEDMDVYLLESMRSRDMWSRYSHSLGRGSHPTFEDFRQSLASSMSLAWSDAIIEGR